ncbi:acyclic terpene utilization AtuA family protein [Chitinivorax sp. B]|uniref:acyclic terpene utilization AtuA family protein n=1 Tax=Chitinivorax sp. B TaxID=2502235 RepID=UPI0010F95F87|nr:acyclic terpene utilization AtuA family protein [Chitinivorax sp. B]
MDDRSVRIGCASGFWGDTNTAAAQLVKLATLDYLVFDYLAEVTLSIMAAAKAKDSALGYATDFVDSVMQPLLPQLASKGIKVISNAGGVNPQACRDRLVAAITAAGLDLKVAVVTGDDLLPQLAQLRAADVAEMTTGAPIPAKPLTVNAYLGATPIAAALAAGADIVITGRVVDSAIVLGPLLHEFKWAGNDYDKLAMGSLAGHIVECGAQCCGGNFTDWQTVSGFDQVGFPIVEVASDASFVVTKPAGTGGLVSVATVAEQIVYEVGDPQSYLLPDVICDFSQVQLQQVGEHRVAVSGARGRAPTGSYKASLTWQDGYRLTAVFVLTGMAAQAKAQMVADNLLSKAKRLLAQKQLPPFGETSIELLGTEATYGPHARQADYREVVVKLAVTHPMKPALQFFAGEIAQAATGMAPGLISLLGGRPKPAPVIKLFSCLVPKQMVGMAVITGEHLETVTALPSSTGPMYPPIPDGPIADNSLVTCTVPLIRLALARSGDKGDDANIGVMARDSVYLPWLRAALTEPAVAEWFRHVLDHPQSRVERYEWPGLNALNLVLRHALGGGGMASLRTDAQGKAFAQQLLEFPVAIPADLLKDAPCQ